MGTLSWEDLTPITGITKKVLEDAGYTVKVTEFSEWGIAYAALAKGDIQVLASQTDYVAQDYWSRARTAWKRYRRFRTVSIRLLPFRPTFRSTLSNSSTKTATSSAARSSASSRIGPDARCIQRRQGLRHQGSQLVEGSTAAMTAALKSAYDRAGVDRRHDLGTVVDGAEVPGQVSQGSEGHLPATAGLLLDRPKGFAEETRMLVRSMAQRLRPDRRHHRHQWRR